MLKRNNILLLAIIIVAALLRFLLIGNLPPSLTWDEAAWGYNSYTLGIDGKDEFGKLLPLTFIESFGDFKPPLYAYLGVIPVKIFGLTEFATRFPSAFFGTLSVFLTYFLVREIFKKNAIALLSTLLLAISPWHIMLSRAAFEANVAHFFVILGLLLFFIALRKHPKYFIFSALSMVLSMYTFNSARIVVPLLVICLGIIFFKKLMKELRYVLVSLGIGFIVFLPLLLFINTPQAKLRFEEVNIFSDIGIISRTNQEIANDNNSVFSKVIHNRRFTYGVEYLRHYFDNLTPQFLFIRGDGNPKFSIQDMGQLYMWEIPFLVIGILTLFRRRGGYWWIVPTIIIIGIIPAGFARETPHALRVENVLPAFQILTAIGIITFLKLVPKKIFMHASILIGIIMFLQFGYFIHNYLAHYSRQFSGEWQYGYKESVAYVAGQQKNYKDIYVTESLGRPYIYYLFYLKYSPQDFRKDANIYREPLGFVHVNKFSNINFTTKISDIRKENSLYIAKPDEKPEDARVLREFRLLNGKVALVAYTL